MLQPHTRHTSIIDTTAMKRARKKIKRKNDYVEINKSAALGRPAMKSLGGGGGGGGFN